MSEIHVSTVFVREGEFWRELVIETVCIDAGTETMPTYTSRTQATGERYRSLGFLSPDHEFRDGQRVMVEPECLKLLLLEHVSA